MDSNWTLLIQKRMLLCDYVEALRCEEELCKAKTTNKRNLISSLHWTCFLWVVSSLVFAVNEKSIHTPRQTGCRSIWRPGLFLICRKSAKDFADLPVDDTQRSAIGGFQQAHRSCQILGTPLISSELDHWCCKKLAEKILGKIRTWSNKGSRVAKDGKLVLFGIHTYWFSLFILPKQKQVIRAISQLFQKYCYS